jgi:DNA repair exonuclease SbcCD nuclease subunit
MKICLLGDTHFGVRNDAKHFHEFYEKFYSNIFFPYLEEHDIKVVIQLGDLFDRRKYMNFLSLFESRRYFFDVLKEKGIHLHALIGNHDIFWRHSLEVNSPDLLLKDYDNITLWSKHGTLELDGMNIDMIPWICQENEKEIREFVSNSVSSHCVGHFELLGYQLWPGMPSHEGYSDDFLENYDQVYSGHYHMKSSQGNVMYLGTPYELFWNDYKDQKGFGIFDTETKELEFINNPYRMFYKIKYDDSKLTMEQLKTIDYSMYEKAYIKIVVLHKSNPHIFDQLVDNLYKVNPIDINIVEDFSEMANNTFEVVDQAEDTLTILSNYIDSQSLQIEPDKINKLKTVMKELYLEALSTEHIE